MELRAKLALKEGSSSFCSPRVVIGVLRRLAVYVSELLLSGRDISLLASLYPKMPRVFLCPPFAGWWSRSSL